MRARTIINNCHRCGYEDGWNNNIRDIDSALLVACPGSTDSGMRVTVTVMTVIATVMVNTGVFILNIIFIIMIVAIVASIVICLSTATLFLREAMTWSNSFYCCFSVFLWSVPLK